MKRAAFFLIFVLAFLFLSPKPSSADTNPIIFIPGTMGTKLISNADGTELWGNTAWTNQNVYLNLMLGFDGNGNLINDQAHVFGRNSNGTRDINANPLLTFVHPDFIPARPFFSDIYGSTLSEFSNQGYTLGNNLFIYGWDWRKGAGDLSDPNVPESYVNVAELDMFVEAVKVRTAAPKVNIIAHSQGGYVAWLYISQHADKVSSLTTIGTPYLGAPKAAAAVLWGISDYNSWGMGATAPTVARITRTFPGSAELMPSIEYSLSYFQDTGMIFGEPKARVYNTTELMKNMNTYINSKNGFGLIIDKALKFKSKFNAVVKNGPYGVPTTVFVGTGIDTAELLFTTNNVASSEKQKYARSIRGGDGTVPYVSANAPKLLPSSVTRYFIQNMDHVALVHQFNAPIVMAINKIKGVDIYTVEPNGGIPFKQFVSTTQPFSMQQSVRLNIKSPAYLTVTDNMGNFVGFNGINAPPPYSLPDRIVENSIPGARYEQIGDPTSEDIGSQVITLPEDQGQVYHVSIFPANWPTRPSGPFDFAVSHIDSTGKVSQMTEYQSVPQSTVLFGAWTPQIKIDTNIPSVLQADDDGDGANDRFILPTVTSGAVDTDGDTLIDGDEQFFYNTDPNKADTDGDGINDDKELSYGSDVINRCPLDKTDDAFYPDVDNDGSVSILDLSKMANAYQSRVGDTKYNPRYDLDSDGSITILDLSKAASYFQKHC